MYYTDDNERAARDEIKCELEDAGFIIIGEPKVVDSTRACRNAYGKTLSEEEFNNIDPDSDEAWFDDYDYTFECIVEFDGDEEAFTKALNQADGTLAEEAFTTAVN